MKSNNYSIIIVPITQTQLLCLYYRYYCLTSKTNCNPSSLSTINGGKETIQYAGILQYIDDNTGVSRLKKIDRVIDFERLICSFLYKFSQLILPSEKIEIRYNLSN